MSCVCANGHCREIERLQRRIAELEIALGHNALVAEFQVWPTAAPFLALLLGRRSVSADSAFVAMYGVRPACDQPRSKDVMVRVAACHLRKRLARCGVEFPYKTGDGYALPAAAKQKIRALVDAPRRAA